MTPEILDKINTRRKEKSGPTKYKSVDKEIKKMCSEAKDWKGNVNNNNPFDIALSPYKMFLSAFETDVSLHTSFKEMSF